MNILDFIKQDNDQQDLSNQETKNLLEGKSSITYYEEIPKELQVNNKLFDELWKLHPKEYGEIKILGKIIKTPRWQASYGQDYYFSGLNHKALPLPHKYLENLLWRRRSKIIISP
jgi:hypothetical protein